MDWDTKHAQFGTFEDHIEETAQILGWSINSVRGHRKKLLTTGLIRKTPVRNTYRIHHPERYLLSKGKSDQKAHTYVLAEKHHNFELILKNLGVKEQIIDSKLQEFDIFQLVNLWEGETKYLGSYKGESNLSLLANISNSNTSSDIADYLEEHPP